MQVRCRANRISAPLLSRTCVSTTYLSLEGHKIGHLFCTVIDAAHHLIEAGRHFLLRLGQGMGQGLAVKEGDTTDMLTAIRGRIGFIVALQEEPLSIPDEPVLPRLTPLGRGGRSARLDEVSEERQEVVPSLRDALRFFHSFWSTLSPGRSIPYGVRARNREASPRAKRRVPGRLRKILSLILNKKQRSAHSPVAIIASITV